jgi:CTP-dependent riboflavin kinase
MSKENLQESMRRLSNIVHEAEQLDEIGGIFKKAITAAGDAIQTYRKNAGVRKQMKSDLEDIGLHDTKKRKYLMSLNPQQVTKLIDEIMEVRAILRDMSKKGQLNKMTDAERTELAELLASKYPMYAKIYGDIMSTVPRAY